MSTVEAPQLLNIVSRTPRTVFIRACEPPNTRYEARASAYISSTCFRYRSARRMSQTILQDVFQTSAS